MTRILKFPRPAPNPISKFARLPERSRERVRAARKAIEAKIAASEVSRETIAAASKRIKARERAGRRRKAAARAEAEKQTEKAA